MKIKIVVNGKRKVDFGVLSRIVIARSENNAAISNRLLHYARKAFSCLYVAFTNAMFPCLQGDKLLLFQG